MIHGCAQDVSTVTVKNGVAEAVFGKDAARLKARIKMLKLLQGQPKKPTHGATCMFYNSPPHLSV